MKFDETKARALLRFWRVMIPQIPAVATQLLDIANVLSLPEWVTPALIFVGAVATALDKFLRDIKA